MLTPPKASSSGRTAGTLERSRTRWNQRERQTRSARSSLAGKAYAATHAIAFGDPFGHTLEREDETEERHDRPEQPHREVEGAYGEDNSAAARELEDRAGFAALGRSEARDLRHVARSFSELQSLERRARSSAGLHASHVADEPHKFLRLFDPDRLARAAHGRRGLDDACAVDRTLKRRPIDDLAQRAVDPRRHRSAEPADLARGLDHRQAHAHGCGRADRRIGPRRHRQTHASQPEDELIAVPAGGKPRAFAQGIAHIAEHKQVPDRRARKPRDILGFTGNETAGEAPERARGDSEARIPTFDLFGKRRIDRKVPLAGESEKTHCEVGVVGGERGIDLARRNGGVERARDRVIGEHRRIILGSEQELRLEGARRGSKRGQRRGNSESKRHGDARCGHGIVLPRPPPQFRQTRRHRQGTRGEKLAGELQLRTAGLAIANPAGYGGTRSRTAHLLYSDSAATGEGGRRTWRSGSFLTSTTRQASRSSISARASSCARANWLRSTTRMCFSTWAMRARSSVPIARRCSATIPRSAPMRHARRNARWRMERPPSVAVQKSASFLQRVRNADFLTKATLDQ